MAILQEYDLRIHPMKLVRGQGLSKAMVDVDKSITCQQYTVQSFTKDLWYTDLIFFLLNNICPNRMNATQRRALRMKSAHYMLKGGPLYRRNYEGVYLCCLDQQEAKNAMDEFHGKHGIGHGSTDSLAHQILRSSYYWPHLFRDAHRHVRICHTCQTSTPKECNPAMPLQPFYEVRPFAQWALDFVEVINPNYSSVHKFILIATDHYMNQTEARP